MATFHLSQSIGHAGKAGPHAAYIARLGEYAPGKAKGKGLQDFEAGGSGNMPAWAASNPLHFWRAADAGEIATGATSRTLLDEHGRKVLDDDGKPVKTLQKNIGQAYKEIELALPRELNPAQRLALVQAWISQEIGDRHAFTFAIHCPKAKLDGGEQPHLHLMYSERLRDGIERDPAQYFKRYRPKNPAEGGAKKAASSKTVDENKAELCERRERWATMLNQHLEAAGFDARVDHRSNVARGIIETPERHFGPNASDALRAAVAAERVAKTSRQIEVKASAAALADAQAELRALLTQRAQETVTQLVPVFDQVDELAAAKRELRTLGVEQVAADRALADAVAALARAEVYTPPTAISQTAALATAIARCEAGDVFTGYDRHDRNEELANARQLLSVPLNRFTPGKWSAAKKLVAGVESHQVKQLDLLRAKIPAAARADAQSVAAVSRYRSAWAAAVSAAKAVADACRATCDGLAQRVATATARVLANRVPPAWAQEAENRLHSIQAEREAAAAAAAEQNDRTNAPGRHR